MIYVILAYISYPLIFFISRFFSRHDTLSILVFQTAKIGDMICTTPVFREIKKTYPNSKLGVVLDPVTAPLLKNNPHIDEIIEFDKTRYKGLSGKFSFANLIYKKGYSAALILMPNVSNILTAFWAMIPKRVCIYPNFAGTTIKLLIRLNTDVEYHAEGRMSLGTYLASLKYFGIINWKMDKEVYASSHGDEKVLNLLKGGKHLIGIILGTGNQLKDWGKENFLSLAKNIVKKTSARIVLLGSEKERDMGEEIVKSLSSEKVQSLCGAFNLEELPSLIKRLSIVIGADTGLIYMADALNVPVVDIAGPCNMNDQRPTGKDAVIIQKKDIDCVPCSHTFKTPYECRYGHRECITGISVNEAFEKVISIIYTNEVL